MREEREEAMKWEKVVNLGLNKKNK